MSWDNSVKGRAMQVVHTVAAWPSYHADIDENSGATEQVKATHKQQVLGAVAAIQKFVEGYPTGAVFSISASGSVGTDGLSSASVSLSYGVSIPAVETVETVE